MKLSEVLARVKQIKPNQYDDAMLTAWVSELDGQLHDSLMVDRTNAPTLTAPYNHLTAPETVLLVSFPYESIYLFWVMAMIDYSNKEYDLYNNNMAMYNKAHDAFAAFYAKDHPQVSTGEITV